ncbi:hypothetical protein DVS28_a3558 [Euzebya pacifica]|uniref:Uncharacterized protein n=1 Tax=Euzebya pacifica TaxID=1608957 RepID=A0A346Y184_9ACTN|nr:hypothetical protein [Euzebya pacifica]AXV08231.1 hypothetical protein DVS28_a3558 [Euzebya pacifica]
MIKVVCDVCGAEEATGALSADWRTVSSTVEAWAEAPVDRHDPAHLCSATCIARWAENHGANPRASEKTKPERGMADQMKRAMKRQVDLRTLEESDPAG